MLPAVQRFPNQFGCSTQQATPCFCVEPLFLDTCKMVFSKNAPLVYEPVKRTCTEGAREPLFFRSQAPKGSGRCETQRERKDTGGRLIRRHHLIPMPNANNPDILEAAAFRGRFHLLAIHFGRSLVASGRHMRSYKSSCELLFFKQSKSSKKTKAATSLRSTCSWLSDL